MAFVGLCELEKTNVYAKKWHLLKFDSNFGKFLSMLFRLQSMEVGSYLAVGAHSEAQL